MAASPRQFRSSTPTKQRNYIHHHRTEHEIVVNPERDNALVIRCPPTVRGLTTRLTAEVRPLPPGAPTVAYTSDDNLKVA